LLQIKYETFLEDVNNILTSGEVPNLFPKDEFSSVLEDVRPAAKAAGVGETQEDLAAFFMDRVRLVLSKMVAHEHRLSALLKSLEACLQIWCVSQMTVCAVSDDSAIPVGVCCG
jgi:hypothetical protein